MFKSVVPIILLICHLSSAVDYGVGFDLSLDYGVASIYFSNGSAVDIAKIVGGVSYRQSMRAAAYTPNSDSNSTLSYGLRTQQNFLHFRSFCNHLPIWLGGKGPRSQPLVPMLKALRTAVESYLETTVSAAEIVVPFPVDEDYRKALRSACSAVSLRMPNSAQPPAGILAARAYSMGRKPCLDSPDDDPPQLILTVDYSRAALTALVVHEECKVFEYRRILHDTDLGLNQLQREPESTREKLEASIRKLVRLPMNDGGNGEELKYINNLVLLGESVNDRQLHHVLKNVLGEQYDKLVTAAARNEIGTIDPVFAASRGVAFDCWDRLNFEDNHIQNHDELA